MAGNWVHLDVEEVVAESENAFLLRIDGEEVWIPKSQIADADSYSRGDVDATVSISAWIAEKKGLA
jgi:hypothetical protein